jgi:hypothetical protein
VSIMLFILTTSIYLSFRYLAELRRIGAQVSAFPSAMRKAMARSPMLLGTRRVVKKSTRSPKERRASDASDDESDVEIHFELLRAEDVIICLILFFPR